MYCPWSVYSLSLKLRLRRNCEKSCEIKTQSYFKRCHFLYNDATHIILHEKETFGIKQTFGNLQIPPSLPSLLALEFSL